MSSVSDDDNDGAPTADELAAVEAQGPCLVCGHIACPFCENWCDDPACKCFDAWECTYAPRAAP